MHDADVFAFIERCGAYRAPRPLLDDLLEVATEFGFDHLILSGVPMKGQQLPPLVELNGWPIDWYERYIEREYAHVDGVCLYSGMSHKPFYWDQVPPALANTPGSRQVAGEAAEFGICSGFAVPFLSLNHWQSVVSFASSKRDCSLSDRERAQLVTVATFAGASVEALVCGSDDAVTLSAREREVLRWTAEGKSAWEVGEILGIAEITVKKHTQRIREQLGVATTVQAVVEAIRRRIIQP